MELVLEDGRVREVYTGCWAGIDINYLLIAQARKQPIS